LHKDEAPTHCPQEGLSSVRYQSLQGPITCGLTIGDRTTGPENTLQQADFN
jgi:hypothetical protein